MTASQAYKLDSKGHGFYVNVDEDGTVGIYGASSGFCYETPVSKEKAEQILKTSYKYRVASVKDGVNADRG